MTYLAQLGADLFIVKPFDINALIDMIRDINKAPVTNGVIKSDNLYMLDENEDGARLSRIRLENDITTLLHDIGIPAHIKGYMYLRSSIIETYYNIDLLGQITKMLYPRIAMQYKLLLHVKELYDMLLKVWNRGNIDVIDSIFGYTISATKAKPTNSEFIAMIADRLILQHRTMQSKNQMHKVIA